jgi:hypothetical protein
METALVLALASIIFSGIAIFISLRSYILAKQAFDRDTASLQVWATFHLKTGRGTSFMVHLYNAGRRPVHVKEVRLVTKSGELLHSPFDNANVVLNEADDHTLSFPLDSYPGLLKHPLDIIRVEVFDAAGKEYSFLMSRLKHQIDEEWTPEVDWLKKK